MDYPGGGMESMERKLTTDALQFTDIRTCWEDIKPCIVSILEADPFLSYRPEDVYSECVNEKAFLYTSKDGFVVLSLEEEEYSKEKTLLVWLGYTYKKGGHLWEAHKEWFDDLARSVGCTYIGARSRVKELSSYFLQRGWELETKVFRKKVE